MDEELREKLEAINAKLDRVLAALKEVREKESRRPEPKKSPKEKSAPASANEIKSAEEKFVQLFDRWMVGEHLEVLAELERMDADTIRRFADANNLNVTAKTPVPKVMELISARFREKKHLLAGMTVVRSNQRNKTDEPSEDDVDRKEGMEADSEISTREPSPQGS
jgi:hypothetical protein